MKQALDTAKDFKEIIKHDKRYWAGAGFLIVVAVVTFATDNWKHRNVKKENVIEAEEQVKVKPIPHEVISSVLQNVEERKKIDEELTAEINRMKSNFTKDKKDINESLNLLSERMNSVSNRLTNFIDRVEEKNEPIKK